MLHSFFLTPYQKYMYVAKSSSKTHLLDGASVETTGILGPYCGTTFHTEFDLVYNCKQEIVC